MEKNEMKLIFDAVSQNESFARTAAASFIARLDPGIDEIADIRTAISEAVTNSIVHAYRNTTGKVYMTIRLLEDRMVYICIKDKGCGIEDIPKAMTPLYTSAADEERAGLGFAVMESFTDFLKVKSKPGNGTSVIMKKQLASRDTEGKD